eukprot:m51a1_g2117 hypothetical protein (141) ;mRNA; f:1662392-1663101
MQEQRAAWKDRLPSEWRRRADENREFVERRARREERARWLVEQLDVIVGRAPGTPDSPKEIRQSIANLEAEDELEQQLATRSDVVQQLASLNTKQTLLMRTPPRPDQRPKPEARVRGALEEALGHRQARPRHFRWGAESA